MSAHHLAMRVHRATLSATGGNTAARDLAIDEIGECTCCLRRALTYAVELLAAEMTHDTWRHADALIWLERTILGDLDGAAPRGQTQ